MICAVVVEKIQRLALALIDDGRTVTRLKRVLRTLWIHLIAVQKILKKDTGKK